MIPTALHFVVPGSINQRTGGYIYNAKIVAWLRRRGWRIEVHELDGRFPIGDGRARQSLAATLSSLPDGARVVVDGLAMGGLPELVRNQRQRLEILALVHLLLADETGLTSTECQRFHALEQQALGLCAGVVVTSGFTRARVANLGVDPALVRTVLPGTDPARPASGPGPSNPPRLLCLASVIPRKGQDVLVRALATVDDLQWCCVCAGSLTRSPTFAHDVERLVREAGLSDRIEFPGECDEETVDALYDASSIFVLPSHFEGYGMVLTEAMARGLPVVATTGGAIPDTVPPETGVLVPPGDEVAMARVLRGLLSASPDRAYDSVGRSRTSLAAAARRHASSLPTWDRAADAFAEAVSALTPTDDRFRGDVQPRLA